MAHRDRMSHYRAAGAAKRILDAGERCLAVVSRPGSGCLGGDPAQHFLHIGAQHAGSDDGQGDPEKPAFDAPS